MKNKYIANRSDVLLPWHHQPDHLGASRGGDEAAFHRRQTEAGQWEVEGVDQGGGEDEEGGERPRRGHRWTDHDCC